MVCCRTVHIANERSCNKCVIKLLAKHKPIDSIELIKATQKNNRVILYHLIQNSTLDINTQDEYGKTALIYSIIHNNQTCFNLLINIPGINIYITDKNNLSAIDYAIKHYPKSSITDKLLRCIMTNKLYYDKVIEKYSLTNVRLIIEELIGRYTTIYMLQFGI